MMIVGVINSRFNHYSYVRNLVGLVPGVDYVRVTDLFGWAEHTLRRMNKHIHITPSDRQELSAVIRQGLEKSLHEIFTNPTIIAEKGEKAIQYIREHHSPVDFAARMNQIYLESIG